MARPRMVGKGQAEGVLCELLTNALVATAALDHAGGLKDTPAGRAT